MSVPNNPRLLAVYLANREPLRRFLRARIGNPEDADDLVQELVLRIDRAAVAPDVHNLVGYLYTMAMNLARDFRRDRGRAMLRDGDWSDAHRLMVGAEPVADVPSAEASYAGRQALEALASSIATLPPQSRRVFVLHKLEGRSHQEVSQLLGIARSTVEKHMTIAFKHLLRDRKDG